MIVYSTLMILCLVFHFAQLKKEKNYIIYFFMICLLFFISAIRYDVGQDYQHWLEVYNWIEKGYAGGEYVEIGYRLLNVIIQKIPIFNVYFLYIITSAIIIFSFGYVIKKNVEPKYWFLSLFIFIGSGIFFATLNLVRQYIAIVIVLLGLHFLMQNKYIRFILFVLLASLFHTSSFIMILFIPFYILFRNQKHEKILLLIYIISLIFIVIDIRQFIDFFSFLIPERWKWYLESNFLTHKNYSAVVKQLFPNLILIFIMINRRKITEKEDVFYLMLFVNVIITNCFYGVLVLLRLSYFFDVALIFLIPTIIELLNKYDKKIKLLGYLSIVGYYSLLTIVTIFIMNGHGVMPYQTLFSLLQ